MSKWEYLVIFVSNQGRVVHTINGKDAKRPLETPKKDWLGKITDSYPLVWDYLNEIGQEGWEVIGMTTNTTNSEGNIQTHTVLAKRLIS
jgi:hypothetical protein